VLLATQAMGTRFEIVLHGEDEGRLRAVGEEAVRAIEHWHGRLSRFMPESDVSRLNRDSGARVGDDLRDLLDVCDEVRLASRGAFDPRIGPERCLDLGAVGKGWALDQAAAIVLEHGLTTALLHGGGSSVVAIGAPVNAEGWPIAIRSDGEALRVLLHDQALGVSAPRGRMDAHGVTHIVDPRTGDAPIHTDTAAVIAPLGPNAASLADAWSTALVVLGKPPTTFPPGFTVHTHQPSRGWVSYSPHVLESA
jgi:thiamine biosynthesis lipoprotein